MEGGEREQFLAWKFAHTLRKLIYLENSILILLVHILPIGKKLDLIFILIPDEENHFSD